MHLCFFLHLTDSVSDITSRCPFTAGTYFLSLIDETLTTYCGQDTASVAVIDDENIYLSACDNISKANTYPALYQLINPIN